VRDSDSVSHVRNTLVEHWPTAVLGLSLALGVVTILQGTFAIDSDTATYYMEGALRIRNQEPYTLVSRGPVLPLSVYLSFELLGASAKSLMWLIRSAVVAGWVVIYLLGKELFDARVGSVAVLLCVTNAVTYRFFLSEMDGVVALTQLIAVYVLSLAVRRERISLFAAAGVALAVPPLAKEVGFLLVPLPALIYVVQSRCQREPNGRHFLTTYAAFVAGMAPWVAYLLTTAGTVFPLFGMDPTFVIGELTTGGTGAGGSPLQALVAVPYDFVDLYIGYFLPYHNLSPLFLLAWTFTAVVAVRRVNGHAVLLLIGLVNVPLTLFVVRSGYTPRQLVFLYAISFLVLSAFLVSVADRVGRRLSLADGRRVIGDRVQIPSFGATLPSVFVVLLVCTTAGIQFVTVPGPGGGVTEDSVVVDGLTGDSTTVELTGQYGNPGAKEVEQFLADKQPSRVLFVPNSLGHEVYYRSQGQIARQFLPRVKSVHEGGQRELPSDVEGINVTDTSQEHLLYLFPGNDISRDRAVGLQLLTQEDVLGAIDSSGVDYIATNTGKTFLSEYFRAHPQFELVYESGDVRIFRRLDGPLDPIAFRPRASAQVSGFLSEVERDDPDAYQWYRSRVLGEYVGLNRTEFAALRSGSYRPHFVKVDGDPLGVI
jgi:hypothetical protein